MPGAIERSAIEENDLCLRVREEQQENGSGEPIERTGAKRKKARTRSRSNSCETYQNETAVAVGRRTG